ncbi:DUF86 domain-containing protein [Brevundimonas lutea]|uniref:HepT-like ribonuclease domain-containing protein n=1 Tax=Brevundimonas lutea TaxID=2293980 RepID=UPI000F033F3C|nr:HepT-like ribonuclease domain-containing protein [Brevundimonas lutea]
MSDFRDRLHLTEMLEAIADLESDTAAITKAEWAENGSLVRAVSMSLIALGEGAVQLSDDARAKAPDVPWRAMIGLRNRLAHAYARADRDVIWDAAALHAPVIREELKRLLVSLSDPD